MIALLNVVDVSFEVGGGLMIHVEIRHDVAFVECALGRDKDRIAVSIDLRIGLCASSRCFIRNTSPSKISHTGSTGTACPLRRSQSCFALNKTELIRNKI